MNKEAAIFRFLEPIQEACLEVGIPVKDVLITKSKSHQADFELIIHTHNSNSLPLIWSIEQKGHVGVSQALHFSGRDKGQKSWLVAAEKIEPKAQKILRENGISYVSMQGSIFLKGSDLLIFYDIAKKGNKSESKIVDIYGKSWLKLYLLFLTKLYATNWTLRKIATESGLSLGTVSQLMKGEKSRILPLKDELFTKDVEYISDLLTRWAEMFMQKGMSQKLLGTFDMPLKETIINSSSSCAWSGEIAAELLAEQQIDDRFWKSTGLRADNGILYTNRPIHEVMQEMRLIPNQRGALKIYTQPWNDNLNDNEMAPLPVIYADLLKGDSRSISEAGKIGELYLSSIV